MKTIAVVLACAALAGCAAKVVSSSPRTVVVSAPDNSVAEAQGLADGECRQHGRYARMIARPSPVSDQFVFDCVH